MNYRISSAFAFAWNLFRAWLPSEIIDNFDKFMMETKMSAMDGNHHLPSIDGDHEVTINGLTIKFDNVRLAPPQGVMAVNYSRYDYALLLCHDLELCFRAIHWEVHVTFNADPILNALY